MDEPKVAVIIPTLANKKTLPHLRLCVESLRATKPWDIIVACNGPDYPAHLDFIKGITINYQTRNQGQCYAVNQAAQAVRDADYLFVVNDDMYFAPEWALNLRFDYPCFSPNLVEPTDNAGSAHPFRKLDAGYTIGAFDKHLVDTYVDDVTYALQHKPENTPGFNLPFFIRRDLWDLLGGYDTAYDPWGSNSDTDLQTRINLAGVTPMRLGDVLAYHFSNKSGTFDGSHQDFYQNNIEYFRDKFGFDRDELGSDVWMNKDMLPVDESKIKYKQKKYET